MNAEFKPYPFTATKHAAYIPALDDGVRGTQRHAVTIVGGGPSVCASRWGSPTTVWRRC